MCSPVESIKEMYTMKMIKVLLATLVFASQFAWANTDNRALPGLEITKVKVETARVGWINRAHNFVVLKLKNGNKMTVHLGPAAKVDLSDVHVGDEVIADIVHSEALFIAPHTSDAKVKAAIGITESKDKSTGVVGAVTEVHALVLGVNYDKRTLVIEGKHGEPKTVTVPTSVKHFYNIKEGDDVVMRVTEAVALRLKETK